MEIDRAKIGRYIFTKDRKETLFRIPDYQRSYVWDTSRVEDFWIDLMDDQGVSLPFIGSFIFTKEGNFLDIVDGQQRILTMYILFAILRDIIKNSENSNKTLASSIQQRITNTEDDGSVEGYTITCWEETNSFFRDYILDGKNEFGDIKEAKTKKKENESLYNIKENYKFLYDLVEKYVCDGNLNDKVQEISNKLCDLEFVYIKVDSDEEAYAAFEIVNARGQELGNIDLLKNLFYKNAAAADDKDWAIGRWNLMKSNTDVPKIGAEVFLRHYWLSIKGGKVYITNKKLFKSIKSLLTSSEGGFVENYRSLLEKLVKDSDVYSHFYDPEKYSWVLTEKYNKQIARHLEGLSIFNVIQQNILFLSIVRNKNKLTDKTIRNIFRLVERFHFAYSAIGKGPTNRVEKLYAKYSQILEDGDKENLGDFYSKLLNDLRKILEQYLGKDSFVERFQNVDYKRKDLVRYIFSIMEDCISGTKEKQIDWLNANIEHIESQKNGENNFSDQLLHHIGNLVIIGVECNSRVGDKPVSEKLEIYKERDCSELNIVKDVIKTLEDNNSQWNEQIVRGRARYIASQIYDNYIMANDAFGEGK